MIRNVVVSSALGIAGMLASSSRVAAAPPSDPCALLTTAEASAALGGTVSGGKPIAGGVCQWSQQGKPGDVLLKLDVDLITPDRYARMKSGFVGTVTPVSGLGDDAFYATLQRGKTTLTTLNVKKGGAAVVIRVTGGTKPAQEYQAKEKAVAQALVPKL
jgi:hypothetical protein